jgi:AraC-like DNA-binding protein
LRLGGTARIDIPACRATVRRHVFASGLRLHETEARVSAPVAVAPRSPTDEPFVATQITIVGRGTVVLPGGPSLRLATDEAAVFRPRAEGTVYRLPAGQALRFVGVSASVETLARWFGRRVPEDLRPFLVDRLTESRAISLPAGAVLREAAAVSEAAPFHGPLRDLMLEGAAMRIMAACLDGLCGGEARQVEGLSGREVRAAHNARARLLADMRAPPGTGELAAAVGLSARRLDQAFRILFGASVFETLRRERLEHARQVLAAGDVAVKDAAWRVGYAHVGNFTRAFHAHFGTPPSALTRR